MTIEERYAEETISHSGLSCLERGPLIYRGYKSREENGSTKGKDLGTAIHCVVLEPERFSDEYLVSKFSIPTGKYATFVRELFYSYTAGGNCNLIGDIKATDIEYMVSNARDKAELAASPVKCWEKLKSDDTLQKYWDYLVESQGKFKLSIEDKEIADRCVLSIQKHDMANELLFGSALSDTYEELDIVWDHPSFKFKMRSIIDKLIVDTYSKTITMVDLKTTSKNVHQFKDAYEKYKYYRQLALYRQAVIWYCKNILKLDLEGWSFIDLIVAVQTTGNNECAVYSPSKEDLERGTNENYALLKRMEWHFNEDKWEYPKEYYDNKGIITLKLDEQ